MLVALNLALQLLKFEGDEDAITQTKVYLMENNVRVEVLGYVQ